MKRTRWSKLKETVGTTPPPIDYVYPKSTHVRTAGDRALLSWYRFLPAPQTGSQRCIMLLISDTLKIRRKQLED